MTNSTNNTTKTKETSAMTNTAKTTKASRKFTASVCAAITAAVMVTGIAVFSASASEIDSAPKTTAVTTVTTQSAVQTTTVSEVTKPVQTQSTTTMATTSVKTPVETSAAQTTVVTQNAKKPVETSAKQTTVVNQNAKKPVETTAAQTAAETKTEKSADTAFVNKYGKHPGECGYGYTENEPEDANAQVKDNIPTGSFNAANGAKITLDIVPVAENTYYCTVSALNKKGSYTLHGFVGIAKDDVVNYNGGAKSIAAFDKDGNVTGNEFISDGHCGTITRTNAGLEWADSDGSTVVFTIGK